MSGSVNGRGWFIHCTIRWILLFLNWQSELRGQHCTRAVLHQSDCFEYPLKFLLKSSYQKCPNTLLIFSKFSYSQRKPGMKNFKTKKKSLYHLSNFNSPLPSNPCLGLSLGSNIIVCAVFIVGTDCSSSTLLPLPLFVLVSVSLEIS